MKRIPWFVAVAAALACISPAAAQEAAQVSGRVTSGSGAPEAAVLVRITALNVGATTREDGTYTLGYGTYTYTLSKNGCQGLLERLSH